MLFKHVRIHPLTTAAAAVLLFLAFAQPATATNIFVAKLNFGTSSEDLQEAFEQFGEVASAKVITDADTGRSRGFGFVEMPNDDEAQAAIDALNETDFDGNTIVVKKAEPREAAGSSGARRAPGGFGGATSNPPPATPALPPAPATPPPAPDQPAPVVADQAPAGSVDASIDDRVADEDFGDARESESDSSAGRSEDEETEPDPGSDVEVEDETMAEESEADADLDGQINTAEDDEAASADDDEASGE